MDLIIVESPTKARTLAKFLGDKYKITASMGHIRDLPAKKLGIDLEHDFAPEYVVAAEKKEKVAELQNSAKEADKVILATDPDREGEAISWHIAAILGKKNLDRISFHEITENAIKEALDHPRKIDMPMVDAQQARRILDRLVGYKLSPLLWRKIRRGLSAGRVQSVAVRLIVEREREILAFNPKEYWEVEAQFEVNGSQFTAKLSKTEISNNDDAQNLVQKLKTAQFKITDIQAKEVKRNPYPPFTTSTLQQAASNMFGWSAKKTMQVAQNLYEAGYISYHRTDSTNLATEAVQAAREYISTEYGEKFIPATPRIYLTKSKVAQEAHEAIRPTNVKNSPAEADRDQKKLYELVWKRFLACQMSESIYKQIGVDVIASEAKQSSNMKEQIATSSAPGGLPRNDIYLFRANGSRVLFEGWQKLYGKEEGDEEHVLPELVIGQILKLLELIPSQHFTQAPPRFNEASLIKVLEEYGIGRPSTYAPIITTIQDRQYVEKEDKKLIPTALGMAVNDFLMANFANILDYKFTAGMEDQLDEIANGDKQWVPVIKEFYEPFSKQLGLVQNTAERVKVETEETDEVCPNDGAPLLVRIGKFGKFLACSKFPECKFTKPWNLKINVKCPKCGGEIIQKKTKSKKTFFGCSNYPTCDFASWNKPKIANINELQANEHE